MPKPTQTRKPSPRLRCPQGTHGARARPAWLAGGLAAPGRGGVGLGEFIIWLKLWRAPIVSVTHYWFTQPGNGMQRVPATLSQQTLL